jgi:type I restriction enzyme S subunit
VTLTTVIRYPMRSDFTRPGEHPAVSLPEHLELIAAAPEGIRKLRGLILELAVRGKLVPQDPNDEPASELLKRIAKERARLEAEGTGKKSRVAPVVGADEQPFSLPKGWEWSRLAGISIVNPRNTADDSIIASFVPMAMIGTGFEGAHSHEPRKWGEIKQGFTHFAEGDIGVAKITPCFENSKACVFENLQSGIGAGTTELHIVRPIGETLVPRFVLAYLKAPMFLLVGETRMTGTAGQKRLPKEFLELNPFPIPPLAEQHRIVAKVDELMALCDRLEAEQTDAGAAHASLVETLLGTLTQSADTADLAANWQRLAEHFDTLFTTEASLDALKQTILQLAVMGKLVPQDPNDEPASELLKRIAKERARLEAEGTIRKDKALAALGEDEKPFELPMGWEWAQVCTAFSTTSGNTFDAALEIERGSIAYVKVGDMNLPGNELHITTSSRYIDPDAKMERWLIPTGSIVFPKRGGAIATNKKRIVGKPIFVDLNTMAITPIQGIETNYAYVWLSTIDLASLNTGTSVPQINHKDVDPLPFPVPPLAEQHRIVAKVDELMALVDRLKVDLAESRTRQERLAATLIEFVLQAA